MTRHYARCGITGLLVANALSGCLVASPNEVQGVVLMSRLRASASPLRSSATPGTSAPLGASPASGKFIVQTPSVDAGRVSPSPLAPSPRVSPSPVPTVSVGPVVAAGPTWIQSIELLADAEAGVSAGTRRFLVASHADGAKGARIDLGVGGYAETAERYGLRAVGAKDDHASFQLWQTQQVWPVADALRAYRLAQSTGGFALGSETEFFVTTDTESPVDSTEIITARALTVGEHCYVFMDKALLGSALQTSRLSLKAKLIADTFDQQIYPTNTRIFGDEPNPGVDGDPKIFILISPAVGDYGRSTTLGYFSQKDVFPRQGSHPILRTSNAKELISINSRVVTNGAEEDFLGTIAHEFQHMINFNQKALVARNRRGDDLWLDEGMAMYAIEANGYGLQQGGLVLGNHVKRFQRDFLKYSLTDWEGNPDASAYGAVYLFTVYLADRFGEGIIREVVTASKLGMSNVEAILARRNTNFNAVFHDWVVANLVDGSVNESTESDNPYRYRRLNMKGKNGQTTLAGFAFTTFTNGSLSGLSLRPSSFSLFDAGLGAQFPSLRGDSSSNIEIRSPLQFLFP